MKIPFIFFPAPRGVCGQAGEGRGWAVCKRKAGGERAAKVLCTRPLAGTLPEAVIHCHCRVLNYLRRHGQAGITVPSARLPSVPCPNMLPGEWPLNLGTEGEGMKGRRRVSLHSSWDSEEGPGR